MKLVTFSVVPLLLLGACQTTGVDQTAAATATMKEIRTQLNRAPNTMDTVVYKLEDLGKDGNMTQQFNAYCKAVDAMDSHAAVVRDLRQDFQKQRDAFTKDWAKRLEKITDAELRKQAADRRDKALAVFTKLGEEADQVKAKFDPWMASIKDLRTYLENDLNASGVKSVESRIQQAKTSATEIKAELATLNKSLGEVIDKMSATTKK
jgi:uncharacterized coiled-coil DUF342 family protein